MGNFEKLSVLVIVVIIVMILVVALHTWSEKPGEDEGEKPALDNVVANEFEDDEGWTAPRPLRENDPLPSADPISDPKTGDKRDVLDLDIVEDDVPGPGEDAPSDAPASGPRFYEIQPRDTLSEIAQNECGSIKYVSEIMALNPGVDPSALRVGTKLRLPAVVTVSAASSSTRDAPAGGRTAEGPRPSGQAKPGGTYTTRAGDTVERISKRVYGTVERWPQIWVANLDKVTDPDRIPAGTELKLP